jgi:integrase
MKSIIAACETLRGKFIEGIPSEKWWRAILTVGYYTALRRRALFELEWTCIDLHRTTITIPGSSMKGRKGQKYRIGEDAVGFLRQIMKPKRKLVFPHGSTYQPIHEDFDRILTAAKIRGSLSRTPHFHKLRRTAATIVVDKKGVAAAAATPFASARGSDPTIHRQDATLGPRLHTGLVAASRKIDCCSVRGASKAEIPAPQPLLLTHQQD